MTYPSRDASGSQRLTELLISISLATDLGTGQPMGHALRTSFLGVCLAREMGCDADEQRTVLQVSLLRFLGCTSDAATTALMTGGNEIAFNAGMSLAVMGSGREAMAAVVRTVGAGSAPVARARLVARMLADPGGAARTMANHCEVASILAARLGLPDAVTEALAHAYERWDGKGYPAGLRGDAIPLAVRIAIVARDADIILRLGEDPHEVLASRAGRAYDPAVVQTFNHVGVGEIERYDAGDGWNLVLGCEPPPQAEIQRSGLDRVLGVFADFVDLKSPWTRGHSPAVAELAEAAAQAMGLGLDERRMLRHAGLMRDIGRVGIENGIWDKPGPLSAEEWEQVRLHPYFTQRILERCGDLTSLATLAASDHERLDGSGYHRSLTAGSIPMTACILAAADAFSAMCADRPYRTALPPETAATLLQDEVEQGRLDRDAVAAVLAASGFAQPAWRPEWPAGLTEREVEVLRLIARGHTNREVAAMLHISPKTVGRHIENLYGKAGVSTRAGATVFAMEHRLLA